MTPSPIGTSSFTSEGHIVNLASAPHTSDNMPFMSASIWIRVSYVDLGLVLHPSTTRPFPFISVTGTSMTVGRPSLVISTARRCMG